MAHPGSGLDPGLAHYLAQLARYPMLSEEEERMLAIRYRQKGDRAAADRLVTSHLRLVAKVAFGYRGYGLPLADLISEGGLGMVKAVEHFDPDRGVRLSAYARWWIRAQIQEYVLHSWSLVKMGTTGAQKKLFFNLARLKAQLDEMGGGLSPEAAQQIAITLDVPEADVVQMNGRLSAVDTSLNASVADDEPVWQDRLADEREDQEAALAERDELLQRRKRLALALTALQTRECEVIRARCLQDEPTSLLVLATRYGITPERVRQIEKSAIEKLRTSLGRTESLALFSTLQHAA